MRIIGSKRAQLLVLLSGFAAGMHIGYVIREWA
jgi:hypothetical protein